jgi:hypothetical protein
MYGDILTIILRGVVSMQADVKMMRFVDNERRLQKLLQAGRYFAGPWPQLSAEAEQIEHEQDKLAELI